MLINTETTAILIVFLLAIAVLATSYQRTKSYGKFGILAWLQSVVLIVPWLIFLGLFAAGVYLNLIAIVFLLVLSAIVYIGIGRSLREAGQDAIIREQAAQRLRAEKEAVAAEVAEKAANDSLAPEALPISDEDLNTIKSIFSIDTFFATETISYQEGAIFKGNLRSEPEVAHASLSQKLKEKLDDQYRLFLVASPEDKPVVIVLPAANDPQPSTLAQKNLAIVLLIATIATSLESAGLILGFDLFSNWGRYAEALPLSLGLWLVLAAHEFGHRWVANRYQIRLSPPFFLPTWQIGSFGAITRFESLLPNRTALFDIAFAGPAIGGAVSLLILIFGLVLSNPDSTLQVPSRFFQSSILVGTLSKVVLGEQLQGAIVNIHPFTVIGWLGLVITSLNLLPTGQLDGGRIVQAIYGRRTAKRTTVATLIILGIVCLINPANPIPLYWAIVILFLQRDLERPSLNELTEVDDARAAWGLLALFLMLVTLVPLSPSLAGSLGIGG